LQYEPQHTRCLKPETCSPKERRGGDSNPRRRDYRRNGFRDRRIQPLCHLSAAECIHSIPALQPLFSSISDQIHNLVPRLPVYPDGLDRPVSHPDPRPAIRTFMDKRPARGRIFGIRQDRAKCTGRSSSVNHELQENSSSSLSCADGIAPIQEACPPQYASREGTGSGRANTGAPVIQTHGPSSVKSLVGSQGCRTRAGGQIPSCSFPGFLIVTVVVTVSRRWPAMVARHWAPRKE
jgi:hypothetical protein